MSGRRDVPDSVRLRQVEASDPAVSAFVSANAGSGKTHVLAQRVIRLLLDGVDPAKILCITFTKAAAANMANRVFDTLSAWIALGDAALDAAIREIGVRMIDRERRARARRLFAAALETPGGLKVQTIHAFCTRILQQFPFEANVAARFAVLDERATADLLNRATMDVLLAAAAAPDSPLGRALSAAITAAADATVRDVVREAIGRRDALVKWTKAARGVEAAVAQLSRALGLAAQDSLDEVEKTIVDGPILPSAEWAAVAAVLRESSPNDRKQSDRLAAALSASGSDRVEAYFKVFLDSKFKPRSSLLTQSLAKRHPVMAQTLELEKARVLPLRERRNALICRDRTAALLVIATEVIARYQVEKGRRGLLDYDDLIDRTLAMLATVDASWVHYKLDLGIDHVLIDEAQDTSPKQWDIIAALVSEFAAGAGARPGAKRTVFAVGDEKQSIFSFQGAAPRMFDEMRRRFDSSFNTPELGWRYVRFHHSFRSGPNVLGAVDEVFRDQAVYVSVTSDRDGMAPHEALPDAAPGLVEIWPLVKAQPRGEIEGWDAPFDEMTETSPQVVLAKKIASAVRNALGDPAGGRGSALRPGDVLVLVRQRGPLFEAIIRALKDAGVAVAGADRLAITQHIAAIDLIALADALLLPDDDLALAVALKSPLFGFDDDMLFDLAWERNGSLRRALATRSGERLRFAEAAARLERCAEAARRASPFAFYAWLLGPEGGRARMLARLGAEAADPLDEFLALALEYEQRETPTLQGFVAWMRAAETEIKRDMEITREEVRVMTVHGAKGLEAPLVILADTTTPPTGPRPPRLLSVPIPGAAPGAPEAIVWAGRKESDPAPAAAARARALSETENEYRRLLYVAMTRAADRLIVCGFEGKSKRREGCWYDLVVRGLETSGALTALPAEEGGEPIRIYRKDGRRSAEPAGTAAGEGVAAPATSVAAEPPWLRRPASAEPERTALSPSRALEETVGRTPRLAQEGRATALARGRLIHRLLQSLPDIAPERRAEAARAFLARAATEFDPADRESWAAECLAVLADPSFAPIFSAQSRAEAPIVGRLRRGEGRPLIVSGQVDRLAVTPEAVLIADYKTDRPAPQRLDDAPKAYVAQLALYRAVLAKLYPDRPVRALLVWTDAPAVMEIPGPALDAALASLTSP